MAAARVVEDKEEVILAVMMAVTIAVVVVVIQAAVVAILEATDVEATNAEATRAEVVIATSNSTHKVTTMVVSKVMTRTSGRKANNGAVSFLQVKYRRPPQTTVLGNQLYTDTHL